MIGYEPPELTRCQRWILESVCLVVPARNKAVTVAELSAMLRHNPYWTGAYLGELLEMGLVATTERTCGDVWWPTSAGRTLGTPQPKAEAS